MGELAYELNRLAGTTNLDAQGAANVLNGTTQVELVKCMNSLAGTTNLGLNGAIKAYAALRGGNSALDANAALIGSTLVFTPLSASAPSGLQVWFDIPTLGLANTTAISSLTDSSTFARHATQATGANQPTYQTNVQNSLSVARFDGVNDEVSTTTFARSQPQTTFVVFKALNAAQAIITVYDSVSAFNTGRLFRQTALSANMRGFAGGTAIETTFVPFNGIFGIMVTTFNGASSKQWGNGSAGTTGSPGAPQGTGLRLGAYGSGTPGGWGNVDIGEVIVYNSALSLANINVMGAYLGTRWGITWTTAT